MQKSVLRLYFICTFPFIFLSHLIAQPSLPRYQMDEWQYVGAFRLPAQTYSSSSLNYSEGPLAYHAQNHSLLLVGHDHHQAIAEFEVPELVNSTDLNQLEMATDPLQNFVSMLDRSTHGNTQNLNQIGGLMVLGNELLINAYEYYDAPADNTHTSLVGRQLSDLAASEIDGFFTFAGGAGHTSGWISPIPTIWQSALGGTHLTGQSSGIPIIGRCSVGPSAFAFDAADFSSGSADTLIPTTKLLDFSLQSPLAADLTNSDGTNNLWTHLSRVTYGFIIPGTRSYLTLGYSGGHQSGVCYKCTQSNGNLCGGYCAPQADDYAQYYWLWDLNDLVEVNQGIRAAHEVLPYDYGVLDTPIESPIKQIGGGTFDPLSGLLYLTLQRADTAQGTYANPPVIAVFRMRDATLPLVIVDFKGEVVAQRAILTWKTGHPREVEKFEIQRQDDHGFQTIGSVAVGSEKSTNFRFVSDSLLPGVHTFRLLQVDHSGEKYFSSLLSLVSDVVKFKIHGLRRVGPGSISFDLSGSNEDLIKVVLLNSLGQILSEQVYQTEKRNSSQKINLSIPDRSGPLIILASSGVQVTTKKIALIN